MISSMHNRGDGTMTKHTPATPLPFSVDVSPFKIYVHGNAGPRNICESPRLDEHSRQDAAYIAHAANAYSKLVEALRLAANGLDTTGQTTKQSNDARNHARALLRELGEE
jgi:hypothetical protein